MSDIIALTIQMQNQVAQISLTRQLWTLKREELKSNISSIITGKKISWRALVDSKFKSWRMTLKMQTENQIEEMDQVIPYQEDCEWKATI